MNIGILLPRSNAYPLIGSDFLEGIKSFIRQAGFDKEISFMAESIGFGGHEKEVYAKTEKLLLIDDVDILIGFIDEKVLELVKPLVSASGKLMIVVNPGANYPANWIPQPNILNLGLQHAFLCALAGSAAAGSGTNIPAAVATTFYDCGYLHLAAMVHEFMAEKGEIKFNYINKQLDNEAFHINELTGFLAAEKATQTLLCVFNALPASGFYRTLNEYEGAGNLKLFVSPMMLEKKALENINAGFHFPIEGYMPWHLSVPNEQNRRFVDHYGQEKKKEPGIFSLLGWEAGMLVKEIFESCSDDHRNGELVIEMLKTKVIAGPRGALQLDPDTQFFLSPAIRCRIAPGSATMEMDYDLDLKKEWEDFHEKPLEGTSAGWTNTYLCY